MKKKSEKDWHVCTKKEFDKMLKVLENSCENRCCIHYDEWQDVKCTILNASGIKKCKCRKQFMALVDNRIEQARTFAKSINIGDDIETIIKIMDIRLNKDALIKNAKKMFANQQVIIGDLAEYFKDN